MTLQASIARTAFQRFGPRVGVSGALLLVSFIWLLVAALLAAPAAFLAGAVVSYVADWWTTRSTVRSRRLSAHRLSASQRFSFREMFAVVLLVRVAPDATLAISSLLAAIAAVQLLRALHNVLPRVADRWRPCRFHWQNLAAEGLPAEWPRPSVGGLWPYRKDAGRTILHANVLPVLGTAAVALGAPLALLPALCAAAVVLAAVIPATFAARLLAMRGLPGEDEVLQELRTAVERLTPEVAVYFSSPRGSTYALNDWMGPINASRRPSLLILRESHHLPELADTELPVVVLPMAEDVVRMRVPTIKAALYTTNVIKNNDMLRLAGIRSAFIIHGDSDKKGSANPLSRVYDEIWVTGEAGRERYARVREGIRPEQVKIVGRPQLADIEQATPRDPRDTVSVLYAPTWEGFFDESDYSSVVVMGEQIVRELLGMGARVLFKPHPATGTRSRAHHEAVCNIEEEVGAGGNGSRVIDDTGGLHEAFNAASVLITDISAVATDFLYSDKPLVVTNPAGRDDASFVEEFPSTEAAYRIGPDCKRLRDTIDRAVGDDPLRETRLRMRTHLVGDVASDPMERFLDAIDHLVQGNTYRPPAEGLRRLVVSSEEHSGGLSEDDFSQDSADGGQPSRTDQGQRTDDDSETSTDEAAFESEAAEGAE